MFGDYWKIVYRGKPRNLKESFAIEEFFDFHKIALHLIRFIVIMELFSSIHEILNSSLICNFPQLNNRIASIVYCVINLTGKIEGKIYC